MSSLKRYLAEESVALRELSNEFATEYRDEALRSFVESPLLPEGSFNLLALADGEQAEGVIHNLALVAYDRFVADYLEQVSAYARHTVVELTGKEPPAFIKHDHQPEQIENFLDLFKEAGTDDPVLVWYKEEGAPMINDVRAQLRVSDIETLASLVRQLEYYHMLFSSNTGEIESYSFIIDIPERFSADFSELGLLASMDKKPERGLSWELEDIKGIWDQDTSQLSSWGDIYSSITSISSYHDAQKYSEDFSFNINQKSPLKEIGTIEVNIESVDVEIKTKVTNKGGPDGQAESCPTSRAAA